MLQRNIGERHEQAHGQRNWNAVFRTRIIAWAHPRGYAQQHGECSIDHAARPATTNDDLAKINGIGATTVKKLNGVGISSFAQIAAMSEGQFTDLLESLDIRSIRFSPATWIDEAKKFAA